MRLFLGIDAGGTGSRYALVDEGAHVLASGEGGPIQAAQLAPVEVAAALRVLAARAGVGPECLVAGLAGAGDPATRRAIETALAQQGLACPARIVGDVEVGAAAALGDGPGVAAYAGTGSFVVARAAEGGLHRVGGRGWLLGDEGSAFDLVRHAAIAVLRAHDGLGPATALTAVLVRASGAPSADRVGAALQRLAPREVAALLPQVLDVAGAGDAVATGVLADRMQALAELVSAAARRAGLDLATVPVVAGGGVLEPDGPVREAFAAALRARGGPRGPGAPRFSAAEGAARLALALARHELPLSRWVDDGRTP